MGKEIFKNSSKARYCDHFSPNIVFIVQSITPILKSNYGDTSLKLLFYFHIISFLSDILDFSYWNLMQPGTTLGVFPGVSGNQCTPVMTHEQKEWARKLVVKLESSFCLNKSCTPWNEYGWQESLSLLDHRYFWIVISTSGKVNTMSLNGVIFNLVWKVTLLCFGFALLRNAIGVELKLAPYFKSVRLKIKSNRDLGHLRSLTLWEDNPFFTPPPDYTPYFYFTLILVLQHSTEMLSERKPSWLGIFKKRYLR